MEEEGVGPVPVEGERLSLVEGREGMDIIPNSEEEGMDLIQGLVARDLGLILDLILSHLDTKVHTVFYTGS